MRFACLLCAASALYAQRPSADVLKQAAGEMVEARRTFTQQMVDSIFSFSELGYQERQTSAYVTGLLEKEGLATIGRARSPWRPQSRTKEPPLPRKLTR